MMIETNFGTWLRSRRRLLDLTQQEFADQVGCARITVRRIESNALKPSKKLALILLEKLGIPEIEWPQWILFARGLSAMPTRPDSSADKPLTNLPAFLTTFIGREKEQAEIVELINKNRIVTLTGSGGVGKTRLSVKVGRQLFPHYKNGVWFAEFASISDPELLPQTVAALFGLVTQSNIPPDEILVNFLRTKTALLIFDNCEHLVDAAVQLAETLLRACVNLHILTTSREVLGISGESVYQVPSLSIPHLSLPASAETVMRSEAARLFMDRAQAALPSFTITNENAPAVAQICSRLDGIPLAIELAAARVRVLKVEQIAERIDDRFRLLTNGSRTSLPRQQTLRAMIDWSHDLLSAPERILLGRLSVFAGGLTLEAAEQVCRNAGSDDVFDSLTQLINKSLVVADVSNETETRYRMLETIRQYAHEKLSESGEASQVCDRHLNYFLELAERAEPELMGPRMAEWLRRLETEMDNLRGALGWSLQHDAQVGLRLVSALIWFWEESGYKNDGRKWLEQLLKQPEAQSHNIVRARALGVWGHLSVRGGLASEPHKIRPKLEESIALSRELGSRQGIASNQLLLALVESNTDWGYENGWQLATQSLALYRELNDKLGTAWALTTLGGCLEAKDEDVARAYLGEGLAIFREVQNLPGIVHVLMHLGELARDRGDYGTARAWFEEGLAVQRRLGKSGNNFRILMALGDLLSRMGDYAQARTLVKESISITEHAGGRNDWTWVRLAYIDLRQGDSAQAGRLFEECLLGFKKIGDPIGVVYTLDGLASMAILQGQPDRAARLFAWADMRRTALGYPRPPIEQADVERGLATIHAQLDKTAFAAAQAEGRAMSIDQIIAYVLAFAS